MSYVTHLQDGDTDYPICEGRKVKSKSKDLGDVSCKRCLRIVRLNQKTSMSVK